MTRTPEIEKCKGVKDFDLGSPQRRAWASAVSIINYLMTQRVLVSALMVRYDDVWVVATGWPSV